MTQIFILRRG